jgi:hypothetical protein
MGLWMTVAVALLLVVAVGLYLRRRGNTPEAWDGRRADDPNGQYRDAGGGYGM